jgi:hypothetical protein
MGTSLQSMRVRVLQRGRCILLRSRFIASVRVRIGATIDSMALVVRRRIRVLCGDRALADTFHYTTIASCCASPPHCLGVWGSMEPRTQLRMFPRRIAQWPQSPSGDRVRYNERIAPRGEMKTTMASLVDDRKDAFTLKNLSQAARTDIYLQGVGGDNRTRYVSASRTK